MTIKVCGLRDPKNIRKIEKLDVNWLGFIFYRGSQRYVTDDEASVKAINACKKIKIGVFVNETIDTMTATGRLFRLQGLQLHGHESPDVCRILHNCRWVVIKAFSIESPADLSQTAAYSPFCDYFLFDTPCQSYGGSGQRFDWQYLADYKGTTPFLLSGGLSPDCVKEIRYFYHPQFAGIDLNSGFELSPALKDARLIRKFINSVRI